MKSESLAMNLLGFPPLYPRFSPEMCPLVALSAKSHKVFYLVLSLLALKYYMVDFCRLSPAHLAFYVFRYLMAEVVKVDSGVGVHAGSYPIVLSVPLSSKENLS